MFDAVAMKNSEASGVFEAGFGKMGVSEDETYFDPLRGIDKRVEMGKAWKAAVQKTASISTTTGGTYTGYGLMPPFVDPSMVDKTARNTPLVRLLPRKAVRGRSIVYNIISAKAGASFLGDDAALAEQVDTRSVGTAAIKYLYAVGRVTNPAIASGEGFLNLMSEEIRVKTASMNEALENEIVNGYTSTNDLGFTGLLNGITSNTTNNSGASLTLEQFRTDVNTCFEANGNVDLAVTDGYTHAVLKGLLMDYQRFIQPPAADMSFGIPDAFMIDGVMVIKDRYMPTTAAARKIAFLDTRYLYLAVLQDYTFQEIPSGNDSQKFIIKWYGVLVNEFESCMAIRYGLE